MENKTYSYKKSSHFRDMLNMSNEPNNILPYTDTQFEEDLKKWFTETKMLQNKPFQMFRQGSPIGRGLAQPFQRL
jgi:hypothetical protein